MKSTITTGDLLEKIESISPFIKGLMINRDKLTDLLFVPHRKNLFNLFYDEERLQAIADTIERLFPDPDNAKKRVLSLLGKNHLGELYEISAYSWLINNNASIQPQVSTKPGETLSKSTPILDGKFEFVGIFFDIKTFEIPNNLLEELTDRLSEDFSDYNIMVEGHKDLSYVNARKLLENYAKIKINIEAELSKGLKTYIYKPEGYDISLRIERKKGFHSSISSIDFFRWAEQNEIFFLKNVAQYTIGSPFILICPYKNIVFYDKSEYLAFRSIARRAFIRLRRGGLPDHYEGLIKKIDHGIDEIADSLSAILFIDISMNIKNGDSYLFINPNARNYINKHMAECMFDFNIPCHYDDFMFDNY